MVMEGRGIAWLPMSLIRDEMQSSRLAAAGAGAWQLPLQIRLCRHATIMSALAESLWHVVGADGTGRN